MILLIALLFGINIVFCQFYEFVDLKLEQGLIRGLKVRTAQNKEAFAFLGIPYATPPLEGLRFKVLNKTCLQYN